MRAASAHDPRIHATIDLAVERETTLLARRYLSIFRNAGARQIAVMVADKVFKFDAFMALLTPVIADCQRLGLRQLMAVIGGSENAASIALHRSLGFELKGVMPGVGFKLGRWMDIVMMVKPLNGGTETLPEGPGLPLGGG